MGMPGQPANESTCSTPEGGLRLYVLRRGHASVSFANGVEKPTDTKVSRCFAHITDASFQPISCGNGDQSYLAPARVIPSRVGANDYLDKLWSSNGYQP